MLYKKCLIQALCVNLGSYYRVVDFRFCASGIQALCVNSGSYYIVYALYISAQYMCACVYQVVLVCIYMLTCTFIVRAKIETTSAHVCIHA